MFSKIVYTMNETVPKQARFLCILIGFFNSLKTLKINTFIQFANLQDKWLDKLNPVIAS